MTAISLRRWTAPYRTPAGLDAVLAAQGETFDLLLGRHLRYLVGLLAKAPSSPMSDALNAGQGDTMKAKTTTEVVEQFNQAFEQHDASLLTDLVGEECVMESVEPAPDGTRYVGRDVNLAFWQNLANNKDGAFSAEDIATFGDRATIRWRFRFGPELSQSVRGVTLMRVRDGKIVEALAYAKSGDAPVATAIRSAASPDALQAQR